MKHEAGRGLHPQDEHLGPVVPPHDRGVPRQGYFVYWDDGTVAGTYGHNGKPLRIADEDLEQYHAILRRAICG